MTLLTIVFRYFPDISYYTVPILPSHFWLQCSNTSQTLLTKVFQYFQDTSDYDAITKSSRKLQIYPTLPIASRFLTHFLICSSTSYTHWTIAFQLHKHSKLYYSVSTPSRLSTLFCLNSRPPLSGCDWPDISDFPSQSVKIWRINCKSCPILWGTGISLVKAKATLHHYVGNGTITN